MTGGCPFTDPERLFQDLAVTRAEGGLSYAEPFEARVVSRYDAIVQALHDPQTYSSAPTVPEMPAPGSDRLRVAVKTGMKRLVTRGHHAGRRPAAGRRAGVTGLCVRIPMMTCVCRCRSHRLVLDL
jgi:hypothetical protein